MESNEIIKKIKDSLEQVSWNENKLDELTIEKLTEELSAYHIELIYQNEELKRVQEQYKISEKRYKDLFENSPTGYIIHDINGNIIKTNKTFLNLIECVPNSNEKKNLKQLIHPDSQDDYYFFIKRLKETRNLQFSELKFKCKTKDKYFAIYSKYDDQNLLSSIIDITIQKEQKEKIVYLSFHDQLTGLYNRHFFEAELKRLNIERNYPIGLMTIDVDGLKLINDAFGHFQGDKLLVSIANCLSNNLRNDEIISRWGGDEFVILFPKTDISIIMDVVNRLEGCIEENLTEPIKTSIAIGFAMIDHNSDYRNAFAIAEKRMYQKKIFNRGSKRRETINAIMASFHEKYPNEELHSIKVNNMAKMFGNELKMDKYNYKLLDLSSLFHDIGKISIDQSILNKPDKLTKNEFTEIKRHPEIGFRILNNFDDFAEIAKIILHHHERYDGKGYPNNLKGKEIPIQDRIISIVDTYEAITSDRPYRKKNSHEYALKIIQENKGTQFDPELVDIFILKIAPKIKNI